MKVVMHVSVIGLCALLLSGCPQWDSEPVAVPPGGLCEGTPSNPVGGLSSFWYSSNTQGRPFFDPTSTEAAARPFKTHIQAYANLATNKNCGALVLNRQDAGTQAWDTLPIVHYHLGFTDQPYASSEPLVFAYDAAFFSDGRLAAAFLYAFNEPISGCTDGWTKRTTYLALTIDASDDWPVSLYNMHNIIEGVHVPPVTVLYGPVEAVLYCEGSALNCALSTTYFAGHVRMKIAADDTLYVAASVPSSYQTDEPAVHACYGMEYAYKPSFINLLVEVQPSPLVVTKLTGFGPLCTNTPGACPITNDKNNRLQDADMHILAAPQGQERVRLLSAPATGNVVYQAFDEDLDVAYHHAFTDLTVPSGYVAMAHHPSGVGVVLQSSRTYYKQYDLATGTWDAAWTDIGNIDIDPSPDSFMRLGDRDLKLGDLILNPGDRSFVLFLDVLPETGIGADQGTTYVMRKTWTGAWYGDTDRCVAQDRDGNSFRTRAGASPVVTPTTSPTREWAFLHKRADSEGPNQYEVAER